MQQIGGNVLWIHATAWPCPGAHGLLPHEAEVPLQAAAQGLAQLASHGDLEISGQPAPV